MAPEEGWNAMVADRAPTGALIFGRRLLEIHRFFEGASTGT